MTTPSRLARSSGADPLSEFIEGVCASDPFKVEQDLGQGYVKLRSTEAEKRQAAQDIKCTEDIVIELLRNSRDAAATNVFLATTKEDGQRSLVMIDDGDGVPEDMWRTIFEPRVTSKLETAHMDKWGMHGRGMALYSIKENTHAAEVVASRQGYGCSMRIMAGEELAEKADQSTFPTFEESSGVMAMRGPKNILRTSCEFALEHRKDITVYVGTPAQIAATLYGYGIATVPAYIRAFGDDSELPLTKALGLANGPDDLVRRAGALGLDISLRTARRIIDGQSERVDDLSSLMLKRSFKGKQAPNASRGARSHGRTGPRPHITAEDRERFLSSVMNAYAELASAYYLAEDVTPEVHLSSGKLVVTIPLAEDAGSDS